ncbi:hypothetical protein [Thermus scotoductus]|uniref:Uncharacterized protein n=1 Tax=Thermus scotoductus TaxID=37636 RepID=A0A430RVF9_THESC|nr:hypothetical protein [Thermus scotoductus]RTH24007.1 hypothetical protein CSW38_09690 [Thermus scotoductus]
MQGLVLWICLSQEDWQRVGVAVPQVEGPRARALGTLLVAGAEVASLPPEDRERRVSARDEGETLGGLRQAGLEMRDLRRAPWWFRLWRCLGGQL